MHQTEIIVASLALSWFVAGCSGDKSQEREKPAGPTCEQRVAELDAQLAAVQRARTALAESPLTAGKDSPLSPDSVVTVEARDDATPIPAGALVVTVDAQRVHVDGQALPFSPGDKSNVVESALDSWFLPAACPEEAEANKRDIVLVVHPDAPWRVVQGIVRAADQSGASRVLFGFAAPSGVPAPEAERLARVAGAEPAQAFAACPALVAALDGDEPAVSGALRDCQCAVDPDDVRAFAYHESGLAERGGRVPVAVALSLVDPNAGSGAKRNVIRAARDMPWSAAHQPVLHAIAVGGAFVTGEQGVEIDAALLATDTERGPAFCEELRARTAARKRMEALATAQELVQKGVFGTIEGPPSSIGGNLGGVQVYGGLLDEPRELQGGFGFGRSGIGPAGGGKGTGTVGPGTHGTIGHGSGSSGYSVGSGRGGVRGKKKSIPRVRIGKATATGTLDKNIIRRYVRRKLPRIRSCYEKRLAKKPDLSGTVVTEFTIAESGKVSKASAKGLDRTVGRCIAGVLKTIEFPKPKGGIVEVTYPFTFQPKGG